MEGEFPVMSEITRSRIFSMDINGYVARFLLFLPWQEIRLNSYRKDHWGILWDRLTNPIFSWILKRILQTVIIHSLKLSFAECVCLRFYWMPCPWCDYYRNWYDFVVNSDKEFCTLILLDWVVRKLLMCPRLFFFPTIFAVIVKFMPDRSKYCERWAVISGNISPCVFRVTFKKVRCKGLDAKYFTVSVYTDVADFFTPPNEYLTPS